MRKVTSLSSANLILTLIFVLVFNFLQAQNPSFSIAVNQSVIEGNAVLFQVNLHSANTTNTIIEITTTDGTADTSDYTPFTTTVTIPAGQLTNYVWYSILITNDSTIEDTEYFHIDANVTSGNTSNTTYTMGVSIEDNDTVPVLYDYSAMGSAEGNANTLNFSLSNIYHSDIIINFTTVPGTANTADYVALNNTVTIPAGQRDCHITVNTINDMIAEPNETFTVIGTVTSGNTVNSFASSVITIIDDDTIPTLTLGDSIIISEDYFSGFRASLDRAYNSDVVFQITTTSGTAGTADYSPTTITKTITAGSMFVTFPVPIIDDSLDEPNENFTITATVTSGNTTNTIATTNVIIQDNDGLPDLIFYDSDSSVTYTVVEGEDASINFGLTYPSSVDTVVQLNASNGTAGTLDYSPFSMTVTIPAGQTYVDPFSLSIHIILDQLEETDETFLVTATVTSGNTYNNTTSETITILDNYNINANDDNIITVSHVGTTISLLANDTLHGLPINPPDVTIALEPNTFGATIDALGVVTIPNESAVQSHYLNYTICEVANPTQCDTATIRLSPSSPIEATYNASYSDYNGDGHISAGDIVTYQVNITNIGNLPLTNINLSSSYGLTVLGGPIAVLNFGETDSTTFTATKIITQSDINYGYHDEIILEFEGTYNSEFFTAVAQTAAPFTFNASDGIELKAFIDTNANGIQDDISEIDFPYGYFNYELNSDGIVHNLYGSTSYLYESNPATTYNLTYQVDGPYAAYNVCTVSYPAVTVAPGSGITTYNFPITATPYQDLSVNIYEYIAPPRPGFSYYCYITFANNSNVAVPSGTVTFTKDPALNIAALGNADAVLTGTGFTYNFTDLEPYQNNGFWVEMLVPNIPTVSLGQVVTNSVSITLPPGDILPLNNTSSLTKTILGSYDPNEKTESHGGKVVQSTFSADDYLTYTIRFENTGTANAINVKVTDVLDDKLDETTIKMIDASNLYTLDRINKNLTWNFFGIDLPPSVPDSMIGHGYVVFKIKPKPGYVIGDVIPNSASIYFDFNPAITTEPCITEFVQSPDSDGSAFQYFDFYPNPAKDQISIYNETKINTIEISSVIGQTIKSITTNDFQAQIDLTGLTSGIYFLKVISAGQEKIVKIVKE